MLVGDVNVFCDHMLLELWCISATDVLLELSFSMFWFNSNDSSRIFLSELALHALWLQIIIFSALILLLLSKRQTFANRNTFSSVNTKKKIINQLIILSLVFKKCIKTLCARVTYVHSSPYICPCYTYKAYSHMDIVHMCPSKQ